MRDPSTNHPKPMFQTFWDCWYNLSLAKRPSEDGRPLPLFLLTCVEKRTLHDLFVLQCIFPAQVHSCCGSVLLHLNEVRHRALANACCSILLFRDSGVLCFCLFRGWNTHSTGPGNAFSCVPSGRTRSFGMDSQSQGPPLKKNMGSSLTEGPC